MCRRFSSPRKGVESVKAWRDLLDSSVHAAGTEVNGVGNELNHPGPVGQRSLILMAAPEDSPAPWWRKAQDCGTNAPAAISAIWLSCIIVYVARDRVLATLMLLIGDSSSYAWAMPKKNAGHSGWPRSTRLLNFWYAFTQWISRPRNSSTPRDESSDQSCE